MSFCLLQSLPSSSSTSPTSESCSPPGWHAYAKGKLLSLANMSHLLFLTKDDAVLAFLAILASVQTYKQKEIHHFEMGFLRTFFNLHSVNFHHRLNLFTKFSKSWAFLWSLRPTFLHDVIQSFRPGDICWNDWAEGRTEIFHFDLPDYYYCEKSEFNSNYSITVL